MIRGYQKYISPMTGPHCKYTPTCSQYAIEALQKYGAFKRWFFGLQADTQMSSLCRRRL